MGAKNITTMAATLSCVAADFSAKMQGSTKEIDKLTAAGVKADAAMKHLGAGEDKLAESSKRAATFEEQVTRAITKRTDAMEKAANKAKVLEEANRRMFGAQASPLPPGSGDAAAKGFLSELNETLGKRSTVGKLGKLLMGGGAIGGIGFVLKEAFAAGTAISGVLDQWANKTITFGQAMKDAWSHVPLFGAASEFGRAIGGSDWLTGNSGAFNHEAVSAKIAADRLSREHAAGLVGEMAEKNHTYVDQTGLEKMKADISTAKQAFEQAFPVIGRRFKKWNPNGPSDVEDVTGRRDEGSDKFKKAQADIFFMEEQLAEQSRQKDMDAAQKLFRAKYSAMEAYNAKQFDVDSQRYEYDKKQEQEIEEGRWANIRGLADWQTREDQRRTDRLKGLNDKYTSRAADNLMSDYNELLAGGGSSAALRNVQDEMRHLAQGSYQYKRPDMLSGESGAAFADRARYESSVGLDKLHDQIPQKQLDEMKRAADYLQTMSTKQPATITAN